ncbi:unnamed protein product, partial [Symbiodinium pilosum]
FLADYEQYMDFKGFLGKGVHHQEDQTHNFKEFLDFEKYLQYTRQSGGQGDYKNYYSGVQFDAAPASGGDGSGDTDGSDSGMPSMGGGSFGNFVPAGTTDGGPK